VINYYYEIKDDVTVFGQDVKYLSITDIKPGTVGWRHLHEEVTKHSQRIWLENANGVTLIKAPMDDNSWGRVNDRELLWLKLICKDIESL
jgi:hypothetical protein